MPGEDTLIGLACTSPFLPSSVVLAETGLEGRGRTESCPWTSLSICVPCSVEESSRLSSWASCAWKSSQSSSSSSSSGSKSRDAWGVSEVEVVLITTCAEAGGGGRNPEGGDGKADFKLIAGVAGAEIAGEGVLALPCCTIEARIIACNHIDISETYTWSCAILQ